MPRVAITDFYADFLRPDGFGGALTPTTSLRDFIAKPAAHVDPLPQALRLLNDLPIANHRLGIVVGSSKGDMNRLQSWSEQGSLDWPADNFAHHLAAELGGISRVLSPNAACATAAHALAIAASWIEDGKTDIVLAGAVEFPQPPLILAAYRNMGALSKSGVMRPFDRRRDGFVTASGCGFLTLESQEHARARGATIHGYLTGWSLKCDATHMTSMCPGGDTIARAIEEALGRAGNPHIDTINAHGTATKLNDTIESRGIEAVFGKTVPISATKPLTGHLLGAAGAVEAIICLLAMRNNFAPPSLNLEEPDAELDLDYIPLVGRKMEIGAVLSLNYGFGGHIGALIFEKI